MNAAAPALPTPKPVTDLKPDILTFDATVAHVRRWKKDFEAFFLSCFKHASSFGPKSAGIFATVLGR